MKLLLQWHKSESCFLLQQCKLIRDDHTSLWFLPLPNTKLVSWVLFVVSMSSKSSIKQFSNVSLEQCPGHLCIMFIIPCIWDFSFWKGVTVDTYVDVMWWLRWYHHTCTSTTTAIFIGGSQSRVKREICKNSLKSGCVLSLTSMTRQTANRCSSEMNFIADLKMTKGWLFIKCHLTGDLWIFGMCDVMFVCENPTNRSSSCWNLVQLSEWLNRAGELDQMLSVYLCIHFMCKAEAPQCPFNAFLKPSLTACKMA